MLPFLAECPSKVAAVKTKMYLFKLAVECGISMNHTYV